MGLAGDFEQSQTGRLEVQIGAGSVPVQCTGAAALAGTLHVGFAGRLPNQGESFTVLTCGSRSGEFSAISNDLQDSGLGLQAIYSDTGVVITVTIVPPPSADFDGDGEQDDYRIFERCLTGPALGPVVAGCEKADFDRDGGEWTRRTLAYSSGVSAVPTTPSTSVARE